MPSTSTIDGKFNSDQLIQQLYRESGYFKGGGARQFFWTIFSSSRRKSCKKIFFYLFPVFLLHGLLCTIFCRYLVFFLCRNFLLNTQPPHKGPFLIGESRGYIPVHTMEGAQTPLVTLSKWQGAWIFPSAHHFFHLRHHRWVWLYLYYLKWKIIFKNRLHLRLLGGNRALLIDNSR